MSVRIVTDSTSDIPRDLAAAWDIEIVPLSVIFGTESFLDGVEMNPEQFMHKLQTTSALPHTAQPSPAAFSEVYRRLLDAGHDICSVHVSGKLSGTLQSAHVGGEGIDTNRIAFIDSEWTSMSLGLMALEAARAARDGASLSEVVVLVERLRSKVGLLLFCDTLEYLERGGRIGNAAAFMGGLLQVKPIITLKEGVVVPQERVRTRSKAIDRLWEWADAFPGLHAFSTLYTGDRQSADDLHARLTQRFPEAQAMITHVGPVVTTHVGPGAVGIALLPADSALQ